MRKLTWIAVLAVPMVCSGCAVFEVGRGITKTSLRLIRPDSIDYDAGNNAEYVDEYKGAADDAVGEHPYDESRDPLEWYSYKAEAIMSNTER